MVLNYQLSARPVFKRYVRSFFYYFNFFITGKTAPADVAQETSVSQPNYKKSYAYIRISYS